MTGALHSRADHAHDPSPLSIAIARRSGQQALEIDFLAGALGRIGDPSAKR
jgi:hypothetical protein